ncbi:hypothetical protein D3C75_923080 [compost metagenome]
MDACTLHMLHDSRDNNRFAVADCVNFDLFTQHIPVDQHRVLRINLHRFHHIAHQLSIIVDNFHCASAQYIGRAYKHRIAE